jgi:hypothetical protein
MNTRDVFKEIRRAMRTKVNLFILGKPGIGKTEGCQWLAKELSVGFKRIVLPQFDEVDLRGIPEVNEAKRTIFYPTEELPYADKAGDGPMGILLLDELPSAKPSVQIICHQILDSRRLGSLYALPPEWIVVATGNRAEDYAFVYEMPPTIRTRCVIIDMEANFEDWKPWAIDNGVSHEVLSYLNNNTQDFDDYHPDKNLKNQPLPRTWTLLSRYLKDLEEHGESPDLEYVSGQVGEGAGAKFHAWRKIYREIPDIGAILRGEIDTIPSTTDKKWCVVCALTAKLVGTQDKEANFIKYAKNTLKYIGRLDSDIVIAFLNDVMHTKFWNNNKKMIMKTTEWMELSKKHAKTIVGDISDGGE